MNLHASVRGTRDELLSGPNLRLRIGEHVVDTGALRVVTRPDLPRLTSKAIAVLVELVRDVGQTVTRDQLLDRLAPAGKELVVAGLTRAISEDGTVRVAEAELLRVIAAALHCPLPPLLADAMRTDVTSA